MYELGWSFYIICYYTILVSFACEKMLKHLFLSSSKPVRPQQEWFKILDAFKQKYFPCTILVYLACGKVLKSLLTIIIYFILIITIHFFIWQIMRNLSCLFYFQTGVLCAHDVLSFLVIFWHALKLSVEDSMVNHTKTDNMEYNI
jgi:hypothetical protein